MSVNTASAPSHFSLFLSPVLSVYSVISVISVSRQPSAGGFCNTEYTESTEDKAISHSALSSFSAVDSLSDVFV